MGSGCTEKRGRSSLGYIYRHTLVVFTEVVASLVPSRREDGGQDRGEQAASSDIPLNFRE